jgi:hypothetical protein
MWILQAARDERYRLTLVGGMNLSITHKLSSDHGSQFDVG